MAATLRLILRVGAILAAFLPALALHGLWRLAGRRSPWPRRFLGFVAYVAGARVATRGAVLQQDVLYLANHLSWLDILVLAGATGTAFVGKGELARVPVVGWLCRLNATVFVDRTARMGVADQVAQIRHGLGEGRPLTIFPEGTTGDGRTLLPFKPALLAVTEDAPPALRVQPVRIDYGAATADVAWVGDESGKANVSRILGRRGAIPVTLIFLDPFVPGAFPGRKAIAAEAARRIAAHDPPLSPPRDDLAARRPVWDALADLFLDTDVALLRDGNARVLAASPYTLGQIERILVDEVTPVCRANLLSIAGEWAGFGADWLQSRILALPERHRRPMRMMWPDWLALRDAVILARGAATPQLAETTTSR